MSKLIQSTDNDRACFAKIKLTNGDKLFISVAQMSGAYKVQKSGGGLFSLFAGDFVGSHDVCDADIANDFSNDSDFIKLNRVVIPNVIESHPLDILVKIALISKSADHFKELHDKFFDNPPKIF